MKTNMKKNLAFILVSLFTLSLVSCMDEKFSSSPSDNISIQTDTVDYNTIFTTIKQPTSVIKIYNRNKTALTISYIKVAGGEASPFKMTVNGQKGQTFSNIDIFSKDSIYVFIDMTLPENGKNTPVVVSDSLLIMCNGIEKKVILTGSGQDVTILKNDTIETDQTFTADKPYLIFGDIVVAENATLSIDPGATLYFHNNSGMKVHGTLNAKGTADKFIVMRGDRTDDIFTNVPYDSVSNQWNGIEFISKNTNELEFVEMRSGKHAIDLWNDTLNQKIVINNCVIRNFGGYSIAAKNSDVKVANSIIANSGINAIRISGGKLKATHCTIASYARKRSGAAVRIDNSDEDVATTVTSAIENCIIAGTYSSELALNDFYKANAVNENFNVIFKNCLICNANIELPYFTSCVFAKTSSKIFTDTERYPYDFTLTDDSPALNMADADIAQTLPNDIYGQNRLADGQPDAGAIEKTTE